MKNFINTYNDNALLQAYFEPIITKIIHQQVDEIINAKISKIKIETEPERPILIQEAALILNYSISHMYKLCRENKIPHVKMGRWNHFYVSELNEWLKQYRR